MVCIYLYIIHADNCQTSIGFVLLANFITNMVHLYVFIIHADNCQTFIGLVLLTNFIMNIIEVERAARSVPQQAHILKSILLVPLYRKCSCILNTYLTLLHFTSLT
jgi:hypothetical protein